MQQKVPGKLIFYKNLKISFKIPSKIDHKNLCFPFVQISDVSTGNLNMGTYSDWTLNWALGS